MVLGGLLHGYYLAMMMAAAADGHPDRLTIVLPTVLRIRMVIDANQVPKY